MVSGTKAKCIWALYGCYGLVHMRFVCMQLFSANYCSGGAEVETVSMDVRVGVSCSLQQDVFWEMCCNMFVKVTCSTGLFVTGSVGGIIFDCHGVRCVWVFMYT